MAKQGMGILDGFSGSVGTVIGYQWRGRWCLRARPRFVHNPRTEAQQEHRMLFRDMVRLAGRMKEALRVGLHEASLEVHMTECNLFVKLNKDRFGGADARAHSGGDGDGGGGGVDYEGLVVSQGPVAPVAFTAASVDGQGVLRAEFEKNPLHVRAEGGDRVYVYAYCPALQTGLLSLPVYRRDRRLAMALPDEWSGQEVHFYGFVQDYAGRTSATLRVIPPCRKGAELETPVELVADGREEVLRVHADEADAEGGAAELDSGGTREGVATRINT